MKKIVLGVVGVAALALLAAGVTGAAASFTDPTGDSGGAPDITAVGVSNDNLGNVTFTITVANQTELAADGALELDIDADDNAATGDYGFDYLFELDGSDNTYGFWHWNGSEYAQTPGTTTDVTYSAGVMRFTLNKSELSNTTKFTFFALGLQLSGDQTVAKDGAPDTAVWQYTLTAPAPKPLALSTGTPVGNPLHPKAGLAFVASVPVKRTDTGTPLASGKVSCTVTVGNKPVRAAGRIVAGKAQCVMQVPKGTKGKMLRGSMAIVFKTAGATKSFAFKIR